MGYRPWSHKESDATERLTLSFSFSFSLHDQHGPAGGFALGHAHSRTPLMGQPASQRTQGTTAGQEQWARPARKEPARPWLLKLPPKSNTHVFTHTSLAGASHAAKPHFKWEGKAVLSVYQRREPECSCIAQITTMGGVGSIRKREGRKGRGR